MGLSKSSSESSHSLCVSMEEAMGWGTEKRQSVEGVVSFQHGSFQLPSMESCLEIPRVFVVVVVVFN